MIPVQLKNQLFCRVLKGTKKPFELEWTKKPYTYEQILKYFPQENYGVLTGVNGLGVLDDDTEDKCLMKLYEQYFPETFRVRDHYYIFLKGWDGQKIKFLNDVGELQGIGQQVVGAGSIHPSGAVYDVRKDLPITTIEFDEFKEIFKEHIKQENTIRTVAEKTRWEGDDINNIPITNIFSADLDKCPSCGCSSGTNFKVYPETNSYFCFHSHTGGSIWESIAISESIKTCSEIGKNCLSESDSKEILKVAVDKYGLKLPDLKVQETLEPKGWALSLNIRKIAERRNMLGCPSCNSPFEFNERMGWYKCNCSKGGIRSFMEMCLRMVKNEIR